MKEQFEFTVPNYRLCTSAKPETLPDGTLAWNAWFSELPACMSQATTKDQAVSDVYAMLPKFIEALRKRGITPAPAETPTSSSAVSSAAGVVKVTHSFAGQFGRPMTV